MRMGLMVLRDLLHIPQGHCRHTPVGPSHSQTLGAHWDCIPHPAPGNAKDSGITEQPSALRWFSLCASSLVQPLHHPSSCSPSAHHHHTEHQLAGLQIHMQMWGIPRAAESRGACQTAGWKQRLSEVP